MLFNNSSQGSIAYDAGAIQSGFESIDTVLIRCEAPVCFFIDIEPDDGTDLRVICFKPAKHIIDPGGFVSTSRGATHFSNKDWFVWVRSGYPVIEISKTCEKLCQLDQFCDVPKL